MNVVNVLLSKNELFKFIVVEFNRNETRYTYKSTEVIEVGDKVIVDSPMGGLKIVTVMEVVDPMEIDHDVAYSFKWIVQVVDTSAYEANKELEAYINKAVNKAKNKQLVDSVMKDLNLPKALLKRL